MSDLGDWLKEKLGERGLTYNAAAVYSGVSQATISDIINKGHIPRPDTLFGLADYFHTPREAVLMLAGILPESDNDDLPPAFQARIAQLERIWEELLGTDPEAADQLATIAVGQAEMVLAAARSAMKRSEEAKRRREGDNNPRDSAP